MDRYVLTPGTEPDGPQWKVHLPDGEYVGRIWDNSGEDGNGRHYSVFVANNSEGRLIRSPAFSSAEQAADALVDHAAATKSVTSGSAVT